MRAGLVVLVLALCVVGGLRLSPSSLGSALGGGDVGSATRSQERQFGGEPIVVSVEGPLGSTLSPNGISGLIELEGELAELDGAAAVVGPGGFINQSTIQADRLVTARLGPTARRAARAGDRARRAARRRGLSAAEAARVGDRARITALGADRSRFEQALARLGGIGLPSIANPAYVNAVVFGSRNAPKARFRWLFPDADHAVILVRPEEGLSPGAVLDLDRKVFALASRASLRGSTVTVGGAASAAAASANAVPVELVRVALLSLLLLGAVVLLALRGRSRRLAATVGGVAIAATAAGVLASSAVGFGLGVATVSALPVLLALGTAVALRVATNDAPPVDEDGPEQTEGLPAASSTVGLGVGAVVLVGVACLLVGVPVLGDLVGTLLLGGLVGAVVVVLAAPALQGSGGVREGVAAPGSPAGARVLAATDALGRLPGPVRTGGLVAVGLALLAGIGLVATLAVRADPARLGPSGLSEARDAADVARQVGVDGELRVALRGDVTSPESVRWLDGLGTRARRIDRRIVVGPNVGDLLAGDGRPTAGRIAGLLAVTPEYLLKPMISTDRRTADLRFGIPPVGAEKQREIVRRLVEAIDDPPSGLRAEPAGLLAGAEQSERRLDPARIWLPAACVLLLLGGLAFGRRSVRGALVPMGPAVAGVGAAGLLAAALGVESSPVVVAVVPAGLLLGLALGLRAEDASRSASGTDPRGAALVAVGLPAALIGAAGLGLLASRVGTVREFGVLLTTDVLVAAVAAVVLVPALGTRSGTGSADDRPPTEDDLPDGAPERPTALVADPAALAESDVLR